jgi:hypothetical protein
MTEGRSSAQGIELPNSDVEADVALSRCAPSGPRSLTPVVGQTSRAWVWSRDPGRPSAPVFVRARPTPETFANLAGAYPALENGRSLLAADSRTCRTAFTMYVALGTSHCVAILARILPGYIRAHRAAAHLRVRSRGRFNDAGDAGTPRRFSGGPSRQGRQPMRGAPYGALPGAGPPADPGPEPRRHLGNPRKPAILGGRFALQQWSS